MAECPADAQAVFSEAIGNVRPLASCDQVQFERCGPQHWTALRRATLRAIREGCCCDPADVDVFWTFLARIAALRTQMRNMQILELAARAAESGSWAARFWQAPDARLAIWNLPLSAKPRSITDADSIVVSLLSRCPNFDLAKMWLQDAPDAVKLRLQRHNPEFLEKLMSTSLAAFEGRAAVEEAMVHDAAIRETRPPLTTPENVQVDALPSSASPGRTPQVHSPQFPAHQTPPPSPGTACDEEEGDNSDNELSGSSLMEIPGPLSVGVVIKVIEDMSYVYDDVPSLNYILSAGLEGIVLRIDQGDALVNWQRLGRQWLLKVDFDKVTVCSSKPIPESEADNILASPEEVTQKYASIERKPSSASLEDIFASPEKVTQKHASIERKSSFAAPEVKLLHAENALQSQQHAPHAPRAPDTRLASLATEGDLLDAETALHIARESLDIAENAVKSARLKVQAHEQQAEAQRQSLAMQGSGLVADLEEPGQNQSRTFQMGAEQIPKLRRLQSRTFQMGEEQIPKLKRLTRKTRDPTSTAAHSPCEDEHFFHEVFQSSAEQQGQAPSLTAAPLTETATTSASTASHDPIAVRAEEEEHNPELTEVAGSAMSASAAADGPVAARARLSPASAGHTRRPSQQGHRVAVIGDGWDNDEGGYEAMITEADNKTFTVISLSGDAPWTETHVLRDRTIFLRTWPGIPDSESTKGAGGAARSGRAGQARGRKRCRSLPPVAGGGPSKQCRVAGA